MTNEHLELKIKNLEEKVLSINVTTGEYNNAMSEIKKLRSRLVLHNLNFHGKENYEVMIDDAVNYMIFLEKLITKKVNESEFDVLLRVILKEVELFIAVDDKNKFYNQTVLSIKKMKSFFENEKAEHKVNELSFLLEMVQNYASPMLEKRNNLRSDGLNK